MSVRVIQRNEELYRELFKVKNRILDINVTHFQS